MPDDRHPNDPAPAPFGHAPARRRILVVEDDFLVRVILAEMLEDDGYDVVQAETGDAALPLCDHSIALLVTDLQLPGALDGQRLVDRLRRQRPDLPVLFTSGQPDGLGTLDGRAEAIVKPYQAKAIRAAIRRLLA